MFRNNRHCALAIHPLVVRVFIVQLDFTGRINNSHKGFESTIRVHMRNLHAKLVNLERNKAGFFLQLTKRRLATRLSLFRFTRNRPPAIKMLLIVSLQKKRPGA